MIEPAQAQRLTMDQSEVRFWRNEIESSEDFQRKEFISRIGYERLLKFWEGEQHPDGTSPYQITQMDEIYPGISSIISNTYYQNPSIMAEATHPEAEKIIQLPFTAQVAMMQTGMAEQYSQWDVTYADLIRDALKYAVKKHGLKGEAQLALFDLLAAGFCVMEANHMVESGEAQGQDTSVQHGLMQKVGDALNTAKDFITGNSEREVEEKVAGEVDNEGRDYIFDSSYIERWNPLDILFDYRAEVFKKSRFIAKRVHKTIAEFNTMFPQFAGKVAPDAGSPLKYASHKDPQNNKCVTIYEIQIKKKSGVCILKIANGISDALDYYELPFTTNGFTLKYGSIDKYGKLYPVSKLYRASKPQHELNHQLTIQSEHADRSIKKIAYDQSNLGPDGKKALTSGDIYALVPKLRPQPLFESIPVGGTSPENEVIQQKMTESVNKQLGTNETAKSGKSDNEFATQDQLESQAFGNNTNSVRDALADVIREVLGTMKDIILQMWDGDDFFKVTGKQGGQFWYRPEMGKLSDLLVGDYEIDIDIVSAERPNPMNAKKEAVEIWGFLMQAVPFLMSKGKTLSLAAFDNVIKKFNMNPDTLTEDLQPMNPMSSLSQPPNPGQPLPGDPSLTGVAPIGQPGA